MRPQGALLRVRCGSRMIAGLDADRRAELAKITNLIVQLDATRAQAEREQARRASVEAFHTLAAQQRPILDQKTPLERRQLLKALLTRVRLRRLSNGKAEVGIMFDVWTLPGAADALTLFAQHGGDVWDNPDPSAQVGSVVWDVWDVWDADGRWLRLRKVVQRSTHPQSWTRWPAR